MVQMIVSGFGRCWMGNESINPREWIMNFDDSQISAKNFTIDPDLLDLILEDRP